MPENEFEKKVSSELQQLRFKPSETVWVRVEERIRRKKKRRVFVIVFLLAGLALLGYWQRSNLFGNKKPVIAINENQNVDGPESSNDKTNSSATTQTETTIDNKINGTKETSSTSGTTIKKTNKTVNRNFTNDPSSDKKNNNPVSKNRITPTGKKTIPSKPLKNQADSDLPGKTQPVSTPQNTITQPVNNNRTDPDVKTTKPADQIPGDSTLPDKKDDAVDTAMSPAPVIKVDVKVDSAEHKPDKVPDQKNKQKPDSSKKDKKWYAGVNIQVGSSNTKESNGLFWTQRERALDYSAGAGGGGVSYATPEVRSRMSFGAGVFARKELSEKFYLNLGLNYSLFRTGFRVGKQIAATQSISNMYSSNASVNSFYRPPVTDSSKTYSNNYHFLGLQSEIGWRFSNWPLTLNLGLEYRRLLNTNALLYDRRLPGFYQDKDAFVKNHLFISGGLSLRIIEGKKYLVELSPFAEGSLTRLFRSDSARLHYTNFGLRLRIVSKK